MNVTEGNRLPEQGMVTAERYRSAAAAIRLVLEGSKSLEHWEAAFVQVSALAGRGAGDDGNASADVIAARAEYHVVLRGWHEQLPRLHEWLIAEKLQIESRLAHGTRVHSWLRTHGQTR